MILFLSFNFSIWPFTEILSKDDIDELERLPDFFQIIVVLSKHVFVLIFVFSMKVVGIWLIGKSWQMSWIWQHEKSKMTQEGPHDVNDTSICLYWCVQ